MACGAARRAPSRGDDDGVGEAAIIDTETNGFTVIVLAGTIVGRLTD